MLNNAYQYEQYEPKKIVKGLSYIGFFAKLVWITIGQFAWFPIIILLITQPIFPSNLSAVLFLGAWVLVITPVRKTLQRLIDERILCTSVPIQGQLVPELEYELQDYPESTQQNWSSKNYHDQWDERNFKDYTDSCRLDTQTNTSSIPESQRSSDIQERAITEAEPVCEILREPKPRSVAEIEAEIGSLIGLESVKTTINKILLKEEANKKRLLTECIQRGELFIWFLKVTQVQGKQ
ncbi:MAG: hypothetical protein ABFC94_13535 [Syntrophomonas sp.]